MFSLDGKLYQLSVYVYHLLIANFLFLITSLLIITIPAAFVSLVVILESIDDGQILKRYMSAFKDNFVCTIPIGIFNILSILFIEMIQQISIVDSVFVKMTIYLFILFLLSYNITLSLVFVKKKKKQITISFFRETFIWTIILYYRFFLITIMVGILIMFLLKYLPTLIYLMGISLPTFIYVNTFNRIFEKAKC